MTKYIPIFFLVFSTLASTSVFSKDWKLVTTQNEISVYSLKTGASKSGVIPFKAVGAINANINQVLNLLKDHQNKPKWSPKLKEVKVHKQLTENEYIFSEYYKTPWPAFDREFLMYGKISYINENTITLNAKSISPTKKDFATFFNNDHIQADVKYINLKLSKLDAFTTEINFEFHGDMKGWMPVWLMNLIQKKWPLRFIEGMRKQLELKTIKTVAKN
jgi:hypothetical protein